MLDLLILITSRDTCRSGLLCYSALTTALQRQSFDETTVAALARFSVVLGG